MNDESPVAKTLLARTHNRSIDDCFFGALGNGPVQRSWRRSPEALWLASSPEAVAGGWINRRGAIRGGGWINGGGWVNRAGGWINGGGGGGGWINRRGGGGGWINRW